MVCNLKHKYEETPLALFCLCIHNSAFKCWYDVFYFPIKDSWTMEIIEITWYQVHRICASWSCSGLLVRLHKSKKMVCKSIKIRHTIVNNSSILTFKHSIQTVMFEKSNRPEDASLLEISTVTPAIWKFYCMAHKMLLHPWKYNVSWMVPCSSAFQHYWKHWLKLSWTSDSTY